MAKFILKDWYGNNCEFDHDQIFVQDANGELIRFTQGGIGVLEELEVTENGLYTPREGVDGFKLVDVNVTPEKAVLEELRVTKNGLYTPKGTVDGFNRVVVDVASEINEMLFNKTNFSGFASGDEFNGLHTKTLIVGTDIDSLKIIDGREYTVYWDDVNYTTYAKDTNYIIEEAVGGETIYRSIYYLGNGTLLGLNGAEDTGEPFALQYTQSKELLLVSTDTAETHSVAIMKRVRPRDGLEMMLQSLTVTKNGTYTADSYYDGLKTVNVDVPIPEVVLQDKTITENGTFTADEGFDGLGSVIVAVEGSGGGSLPPGMYFEQITPTTPNFLIGKYFEWNGDLYLSQKMSVDSDLYNIYKLIDGTLTAVATDLTIYVGSSPFVFDNIVHFIYGTYHYTWDGTTLTRLNNTGNTAETFFVYNNELYAYSINSSPYYKWDKETDTWNTVGLKYTGKPFLLNGEVYAIYSKELRKVDVVSGTYVTVKTLDITPAYDFVGCDGMLYLCDYSGSNGVIPWYRYNPIDNEVTPIGTGIPIESGCYFYTFNNENRIAGGYSKKFHAKIHIIE